MAIVGSRGYAETGRVENFVAKLAAKYPMATVISGGARGVDAAAEFAAEQLGLTIVSYRPYRTRRGWMIARHLIGLGEDVQYEDKRVFDSFGAAAFARNADIVGEAEHVVAFWDGRSRGTANSIETARRLGRQVWCL